VCGTAAPLVSSGREPTVDAIHLDVKILDRLYTAGVRDEVDELLEAWGRERADLDLAPVAVFSRISRLARRLELARRDAFATHGMEEWEFDVLAALRRAGAPYELSPGRLVRETLVTSGTMTNRIDRLSARSWVERHPDPDDRRGVIVRLTPEGRTSVDAAFAALLEAEQALLEAIPERDRDRLAVLLRQLLAPFADR
jgi:DNA-binding MarR family transcriptional regulator